MSFIIRLIFITSLIDLAVLNTKIQDMIIQQNEAIQEDKITQEDKTTQQETVAIEETLTSIEAIAQDSSSHVDSD